MMSDKDAREEATRIDISNLEFYAHYAAVTLDGNFDLMELATILAGTQAQAAQWIGVKEKLPGGKAVLVYAEGLNVIAQYYEGQWYYPLSDQKMSFEVTHWQPLPVAPVAALEGNKEKK